jgi:flagellar hook protein FlgE
MSFQQGLSGLNGAAKALDVIGNNVANTSTVGFKQSRAEFSDVYAASLSGAGSSNVGLGTQVAAVTQQFTQGNITASNNPMDVAINGRGFFRMSQAGSISYTRNGQFQMDKNNFIVDARGLQLTGFAVNATTGVLDTSTPVPIQLNTGDQTPLVTGGSTSNPGVNAQLNLDSRNDIIPSYVSAAVMQAAVGSVDTAASGTALTGAPASMATAIATAVNAAATAVAATPAAAKSAANAAAAAGIAAANTEAAVGGATDATVKAAAVAATAAALASTTAAGTAFDYQDPTTFDQSTSLAIFQENGYQHLGRLQHADQPARAYDAGSGSGSGNADTARNAGFRLKRDADRGGFLGYPGKPHRNCTRDSGWGYGPVRPYRSGFQLPGQFYRYEPVRRHFRGECAQPGRLFLG